MRGCGITVQEKEKRVNTTLFHSPNGQFLDATGLHLVLPSGVNLTKVESGKTTWIRDSPRFQCEHNTLQALVNRNGEYQPIDHFFFSIPSTVKHKATKVSTS